MKKGIFISIAIFFSLIAYSEDLPDAVINAINSGNAKSLAAYFNNTIELTLLDKEGVYSKTQAEIILKDFFEKYPVKQFKVLHQGGKESSKYAIGTLSTDSNTFRITLFFKTEGAGLLIHQLRIENEYGE